MLSPIGPGQPAARGRSVTRPAKRYEDESRHRYSEQLAGTVLTRNPVASFSYTILVLTLPRDGARPLFWGEDRPLLRAHILLASMSAFHRPSTQGAPFGTGAVQDAVYLMNQINLEHSLRANLSGVEVTPTGLYNLHIP
jgi:hypothetical protein